MNRNRRFLLVLLALVVGVMSLPILGANNDAGAAQGTKFFVVEWRLTWDQDAKEIIHADGTVTKVLSLVLNGRTKQSAGSVGSDFKMEIEDATPFLDILRTCATNRLQGTAITSSRGDTVIGTRLTSLTCRAILK